MILWVKEYYDILTMQKLFDLIKPDIVVKEYTSDCRPASFDIVLISNQDSEAILHDFFPARRLIYEEIFEKIIDDISWEFYYCYDYYYLKKQLDTAKYNSAIDTLISGSSYGLFAVEDRLLNNAVNLSLPSQDLYYSMKGIYDVYKVNPNIRNIVICCGYYYFYSDLSLVHDQNELLRISKVYEPLFHDIHNCVFIPPKVEYISRSKIFDSDHFLNIFIESSLKSYFNEERNREAFKIATWENSEMNWQELDEDERDNAARKRTDAHNKSLRYSRSLKENTELFNEFSIFCQNNIINLLVVITPASKNYVKYLNPDFKNSLYTMLNEAIGTIHFYDLFSSDLFNDKDFNDTDHLNDKGAIKFSSFIKNELETLLS